MSHWSDKHASSYDKKWGELDFHQKIPGLSKVKPGYNILEIGCGGGYLALCLAQFAQGVTVCAIDPTQKMIQLAEDRRQKADLPSSQLYFIQTGAEELKIQDQSLDLAIAAFSLHHWQKPELAISLLFNALKPRARFWLCEDLNTPINGDMQVNSGLKAFSGIQQLLEQAGFVSIQQSQYSSGEGEFLIVEAETPCGSE